MSDETKGPLHDLRVRPIIVLPVGECSKEDIQELRDNGICVVEAKDPSLVRFIDPPPTGYTEREKAAIELCRMLLVRRNNEAMTRPQIATLFAEILLTGSPLTPVPSAESVPSTPARKRI